MENRRVDPENLLNLNAGEHLARTLSRFRGSNGQARENLGQDTRFRPGEDPEDFRNKLQRALDRLDGKRTPEQARLMKLVEAQYKDSLAFLQQRGLYRTERDTAPPTLEETMDLLLSRLSPQQIVNILSEAKKPQFQLLPQLPFVSYVAALDGNKVMQGQIDTYVSDGRRAAWTAQDQAAGLNADQGMGWDLGIMDVEQEKDADPTLTGLLGEKRDQAEKKFKAMGLRFPSQRQYGLAQLAAIANKQPLDKRNWSALDDGNEDRSVVPGGYWAGDQVSFDEHDPGNRNDFARFRPSVVVPVPRKAA